MQLRGEEQDKSPLAQGTAHNAGAVLEPAVHGIFADFLAGLIGVAPALAAGDVDLQVGIQFVIFGVVACIRVQGGVHHVDEYLVAVHLCAAVRQGRKVVGEQVVDGGVQIGMQPVVAGQMLQSIADHGAFLQKRSARLPSEKRRRGGAVRFYSFAMAASIMACASATMGSSSGIRPGMGSRTPPSSRPYIRRRISFCTAYRLPWASHIL